MARGSSLKEIEDFPRRIKIFFWVIFSLFLIGTVSFYLLGERNIDKAFFRTLQPMIFIFNDEVGMVERFLDIFLALVGVFLVWWVLWSMADMLLEGNLSKYLKTKIYEIKINSMKNHIIIAGGGRFGEEIAKVLNEKKQKFIIVEINEEIVKTLRKKGYLTLTGNIEHEETLIKSGLKNAKKLILAIPQSEISLLVTLSAKELNPSIEVYARCENPKHISKLKKAGAKIAVVPEVVAADKLAESLGI